MESILIIASFIAWPVITFVTQYAKDKYDLNGSYAIFLVSIALAIVYTLVTVLLDQATLQAIIWYTSTTSAVAMMIYNFFIKEK